MALVVKEQNNSLYGVNRALSALSVNMVDYLIYKDIIEKDRDYSQLSNYSLYEDKVFQNKRDFIAEFSKLSDAEAKQFAENIKSGKYNDNKQSGEYSKIAIGATIDFVGEQYNKRFENERTK